MSISVLRHRRGKFTGSLRSPGLAGGSGPQPRRMAGLSDLSSDRGLSGEIRGHRRYRRLSAFAAARGARGRRLISSNTPQRFFMSSACSSRFIGSAAFRSFRPAIRLTSFFWPRRRSSSWASDSSSISMISDPNCSRPNTGTRASSIGRCCFSSGCSYAMADFVITANATFKDIAVRRGGKSPDAVEVVYGRARPKAHPSRRARAGTAGDAQIHSRLSRRDRRAGRRRSFRARGRRARPRQGVLRLSRGRRRRRAGARFRARTRECARPCRFLRLHRVSQRRAAARPYQRF